MPYNSIIVTYRNRKDSLSLFLRCIQYCHNRFKEKDYDLTIIDLNSNDGSYLLEEEYKRKINLKYHNLKYNNIFWKTKAINYGVSKTDSELITLIDIDSVLQTNFIRSIEDFFKNNQNVRKLNHRVRFLSLQLTGILRKKRGLIKEPDIQFIVQNYKTFRIAKERYDRNGIIFFDNLPPEEKTKPIIENCLGNSHCTMYRNDYMAIGGHDERFIGHGLEDTDFNLRLYRYLQSGSIRNIPQYDIFHLQHNYTGNWVNPEQKEISKKIYKENLENSIISVDMKPDWGKF